MYDCSVYFICHNMKNFCKTSVLLSFILFNVGMQKKIPIYINLIKHMSEEEYSNTFIFL